MWWRQCRGIAAGPVAGTNTVLPKLTKRRRKFTYRIRQALGVVFGDLLLGEPGVTAKRLFPTYERVELEVWIEGAPRTLIHNGVLNEDIMRSELMTRHELAAALRAAGCAEIEHVRVATLENNGQITVSLQPRVA
jgi:hypothetical protein